jgi:hypothetical protein
MELVIRSPIVNSLMPNCSSLTKLSAAFGSTSSPPTTSRRFLFVLQRTDVTPELREQAFAVLADLLTPSANGAHDLALTGEGRFRAAR